MDEAHDAVQAMAQVICQAPVCVCVLLDITLAHVDGLELAKMIRHRCGDDVVLIAVTGSHTSHPRVAEALALVDHHFMKPLDFERLLKILKSWRSERRIVGDWARVNGVLERAGSRGQSSVAASPSAGSPLASAAAARPDSIKVSRMPCRSPGDAGEGGQERRSPSEAGDHVNGALHWLSRMECQGRISTGWWVGVMPTVAQSRCGRLVLDRIDLASSASPCSRPERVEVDRADGQGLVVVADAVGEQQCLTLPLDVERRRRRIAGEPMDRGRLIRAPRRPAVRAYLAWRWESGARTAPRRL